MVETHRTEQPISLPTIPANVGVPLLRSLVYGAFHLGGAIFATHISRKTFLVVTQEASFDVYLWLLRKAVESVNSLTVGGLMFFVSALYHWPKEVVKSDEALWKIEEITQRDLNQDGVIGRPAPKVPVHPIREFFTPTGTVEKGEYISRKIPWTDWQEGNAVAIAVLHNKVPFSRRKLTEAGALPDDPEHYTDLFTAFIDAGYLTPHGNGGKLTELGHWYLAQFLPPPLRRNVSN